jgi:hypothetical protein
MACVPGLSVSLSCHSLPPPNYEHSSVFSLVFSCHLGRPVPKAFSASVPQLKKTCFKSIEWQARIDASHQPLQDTEGYTMFNIS